MEKTVEMFRQSVAGIRLGVVNTGVIDSIRVPLYDSIFQINQLATSGRHDNVLWVEPFDRNNLGAILLAIQRAGFTAYTFSKTRIIVSIPPISGDEKQKVVKHLQKLAEEARVSVRNIRKNWRNSLSSEDLRKQDKTIQSATDQAITTINEILESKLT